MVEQKPSKLTTRVRFPSPAPINNRNTAPYENNNRVVEKVVDARREREGSTQRYGERDQQSRQGLIDDRGSPCGSVVEHSLGKGEATRSIRVMGTKF